ncbi:hypothetical protein DFS34DRAFT_231 [Phlyctochytrium arcticum]|nr:hypothetical protein DFS34DRAFT_231 [Phlyctochytrium arcticum]
MRAWVKTTVLVLIVAILNNKTRVFAQESSNNSTSGQVFCPPPLVPTPANFSSLHLSACDFNLQCCLPCPASNFLYPPNQASHTLLASSVIRLISGLCSLAICLSYLVLPGKRSHPKVFFLYITGILALWYFTSMSFFLSGQGKAAFCAGDGVSQATSATSATCGAQGAVLLWLTIALACWTLIFTLNLHLEIVWANSILGNYHWALHLLCWIPPTIVSSLALAYGKIDYTSGTTCWVSWTAHTYILEPLIAITAVILFLHALTTLWMVATFFARRILKKEYTQHHERMTQRQSAASAMPTRTVTFMERDHQRASTENMLADLGYLSPPPTPAIKTLGSGMHVKLFLFGVAATLLNAGNIALYLGDRAVVTAAFKLGPTLSGGTTNPINSLLTCMYELGLSNSFLSAESVYGQCKTRLTASKQLEYPSVWQETAEEIIASISGFMLLVLLVGTCWGDWRRQFNGQERLQHYRSSSSAVFPPGDHHTFIPLSPTFPIPVHMAHSHARQQHIENRSGSRLPLRSPHT